MKIRKISSLYLKVFFCFFLKHSFLEIYIYICLINRINLILCKNIQNIHGKLIGFLQNNNLKKKKINSILVLVDSNKRIIGAESLHFLNNQV